ncbi:MAG: hypothetical protein WAZ12_00735 [Candidatus Absconditicoccaceae bacterium]
MKNTSQIKSKDNLRDIVEQVNKLHRKNNYITSYKFYILISILIIIFSSLGFYLTYFENKLIISYIMSSLYILFFLMFYFLAFGRDKIKRMFITSLIGISSIYSQLSNILKYFDKNINEFSWIYHIIPGIYFILFSFLLRRALVDICRSINIKYGERIGNGILLGSWIISIIVSLL